MLKDLSVIGLCIGVIAAGAYAIYSLENIAAKSHIDHEVEYTMLCRVHKDSYSKNFLVLECLPHIKKESKSEFKKFLQTTVSF